MKYKIKNMTYSPLRVIINNIEVRFDSRKYIILDEISKDLLSLERKGLIKIRQIK